MLTKTYKIGVALGLILAVLVGIKADASVLYSQLYDNSTTLDLTLSGYAGGNWAVNVGSFVSDGSQLTSNSTIYLTAKNNTTCNGIGLDVLISSSSTAVVGSFGYFRPGLPNDNNWYTGTTTIAGTPSGTLNNGQTYYLITYKACGGGTSASMKASSDQKMYGWISTSSSSPPVPLVTSITSVIPTNNSINATSSSFTLGVTGYIMASDFATGTTRVNISLGNNGGVLFSPVDVASSNGITNISFPVSSPGYFGFSTTTNIQAIGKYTMTSSIAVPYLWFFTNNLVSTTTSFTVSTSSSYDLFNDQQKATINQLISTATTSITACSINWSTILDLPTCLTQIGTYLIVPQQSTWVKFNGLISTIQQKPPVGYFTIISSSLGGINASSTATVSIVIPGHIKQYLFNPLDLGLGAIMWFYYLSFFYRRIKHITI